MDDLIQDDKIEVRPKEKNIVPWIVTILIAAWFISMSILGAGWIISREIAKQSGALPVDSQPEINTPIDIQIPDNKPRQGSGDAKVVMIQFADFQCPFCGQWHQEIYPNLKSEYIDSGKVQFVYWDFAFLGEESFKAAEAAMCAKDQNKFWEYHDKLFASQNGENEGAFADNNLKQFASDAGVDSAQFNSCFDARTYKSAVEESTNQGTGYGVGSTPTVFINGLKFEGVLPWENYKQIIESELAK